MPTPSGMTTRCSWTPSVSCKVLWATCSGNDTPTVSLRPRPGLPSLVAAADMENSRSKMCCYADQVGDCAKSALCGPSEHGCHGRSIQDRHGGEIPTQVGGGGLGNDH